MISIDAGSLDRRVRLLRFGLAENEYGDETEGFAPLADVWGSVRPAPGAERLANAENAANAVTVVTVRWSTRVADLNPKDRVEYPIGSGRQFDIKSVTEKGRRVALEIAAVGRADQ
ncbi:phage head closure protein [Sphingomonas immobilis]|uniref:Phage head closure protein n=1 Tax=Sphingomonas immobilis TaxID=3063997 RepID=A0ABT8ZV44_9SPHN|nr:phage head closure protein [Sphingomonas sp. CA1-15]MDO7841082.1 phage head closure protein [Sphingomonas sp. CA1-15]